MAVYLSKMAATMIGSISTLGLLESEFCGHSAT